MKLGNFVWIMILCSIPLCSKETQVSLSATHNLAFIGDRVGVTLLLKADPTVDDMKVDFPSIGKNCVIVESGNVEKRIVPEGVVLEQKFELAFFDLGDFNIGPAQVVAFSQGERKEEFTSNEVPITVKPLLQEEQAELEAGKPPIYLSGSPFYLLHWLWIPIVLGLALAGLWFLLVKKRREIEAKIPPLSPFAIMMQELNRLMEERLYEKGFQVLFFLRLSHLLKKFLSGWHEIDAEEMTTEEIRVKLNGKTPGTNIWSALMKTFEFADLVKFARYEMGPAEYEDIRNQLQRILHRYGDEERKRVAAAEAGGATHA